MNRDTKVAREWVGFDGKDGILRVRGGCSRYKAAIEDKDGLVRLLSRLGDEGRSGPWIYCYVDADAMLEFVPDA